MFRVQSFASIRIWMALDCLSYAGLHWSVWSNHLSNSIRCEQELGRSPRAAGLEGDASSSNLSAIYQDQELPFLCWGKTHGSLHELCSTHLWLKFYTCLDLIHLYSHYLLSSVPLSYIPMQHAIIIPPMPVQTGSLIVIATVVGCVGLPSLLIFGLKLSAKKQYRYFQILTAK